MILLQSAYQQELVQSVCSVYRVYRVYSTSCAVYHLNGLPCLLSMGCSVYCTRFAKFIVHSDQHNLAFDINFNII